MSKLPEKSFRGLYYTLTQYYVRSRGNSPTYWGSKSPAEAFWIRELHRDFPKGKFIFLYRDGRDVATDLVNTIWAPFNHISASKNWLRHMSAIQNAINHLSDDSYLELFYEDFVQSPEKNLIKICNFLELDYQKNMLEFYTQKPDDFVITSYHAKTNTQITDEYVGIHQKTTRREQAQQLEIMREMLDRLGYDYAYIENRTKFWEKLRYFEEDDHGGMMARGGVELMHQLHFERQERFQQGIWNMDDQENYLKNVS